MTLLPITVPTRPNQAEEAKQKLNVPLGRKALTRTTTLTLPPTSILIMCGGTVPSRERRDGVEAEERMILATDFISLLSNATRSIPASVGVEFCCDLDLDSNSNCGNSTIPDSVSQNSVIAWRYRCRLRLSGMPYI